MIFISSLLCEQVLFLFHSKPLCFHLEREEKVTLMLLANSFPLPALLEPDCIAEILLISCQSLHQVGFRDFEAVGSETAALSPPFVQAHSVSPAKPVALTSSAFISVQLRA